MAVVKSMNILVVDDYSTMRRIIKNLLKQLGFENVDEASDGVEAFRKCQEKPYGLIVSDWNMQPVTGMELLKQVRADERIKDTPFIMVTAESRRISLPRKRRAPATISSSRLMPKRSREKLPPLSVIFSKAGNRA
jgi:two-component system chemotaxis response regulator CheY